MHSSTTATTAEALSGTFAARYGAVFVWHAASATLAWCVLAPLGLAWMRATRRAGYHDVVRGHRALMYAVVALTVQAYGVAVVYQRRTPHVHKLLGTGVLLLAVLQATWGAMRPSADSGVPRGAWAGAHRVIACVAFVLAAYTCHHSVYVFKLPALPAAMLHTALGASVCALLCAEFLPVSACKRITGRRGGYFEDDHAPKLPDDPLGSGVGFRVVDDDEADEEAALAMNPHEQGNGHT